MFSPPEIEVTAVLQWIREISIIGGILIFGWKARDIFQNVKDFTDAIRKHMTTMEAFAVRMETNHLRHIETCVRLIAARNNKNDAALLASDFSGAEASASPSDEAGTDNVSL
jgi:hypothetical protein